jgi:hypothetical protein
LPLASPLIVAAAYVEEAHHRGSGFPVAEQLFMEKLIILKLSDVGGLYNVSDLQIREENPTLIIVATRPKKLTFLVLNTGPAGFKTAYDTDVLVVFLPRAVPCTHKP